jgi:hypothetical protein
VREYGKCFDRLFLAIENLSNEEIYAKIKNLKDCLVFVVIAKVQTVG